MYQRDNSELKERRRGGEGERELFAEKYMGANIEVEGIMIQLDKNV